MNILSKALGQVGNINSESLFKSWVQDFRVLLICYSLALRYD